MDVARLLATTPALLAPLQAVAALGLPDGWIGAGFIRNAVWDALSGLPFGSNPPGDVDVVWFDATHADAATDAALEARLCAAMPNLPWSVANQARMHVRNGDAPYAGTQDAVAHWPEIATAVLARWTGESVEVAAPHGLEDLLSLTLRPTPHFAARSEKRAILRRRLAEKAWQGRWPGLTLAL
jgi:hypothetical protein